MFSMYYTTLIGALILFFGGAYLVILIEYDRFEEEYYDSGKYK